MALIAAGGPGYELSLVNLETGNIELLYMVNEATGRDNSASSISIPSYYRESLIRDCFNNPEKQETN